MYCWWLCLAPQEAQVQHEPTLLWLELSSAGQQQEIFGSQEEILLTCSWDMYNLLEQCWWEDLLHNCLDSPSEIHLTEKKDNNHKK